MTREEIMALSDDELRIAVAKTRGYCAVFFPSVRGLPSGWRITEPEVRLTRDDVDYLYPTEGEAWAAETADYPHDIAAAWSLWNDIEAAGFEWMVGIDHGRYFVQTEPRMGCARPEAACILWVDSRAEIPRAICRHLLLVKGVSA